MVSKRVGDSLPLGGKEGKDVCECWLGWGRLGSRDGVALLVVEVIVRVDVWCGHKTEAARTLE